MGFKLPKLTGTIDCGELGYPDLVFDVWLNPTIDNYEPPEKSRQICEQCGKKYEQDAPPWESIYWRAIGRMLERVTIPAAFSDTGQQEVVELLDGKAVFDMADGEGFDPRILTWVVAQYGERRDAMLEEALKN